MNEHTVVNSLFMEQDNFKFVRVSFGTYKAYAYKTTLDLQVDDIVVVPTGDLGTLKCATVIAVDVDVDIEDDNIHYKWVASKVDREHYDAMVDMEKQLLQALRKKKREQIRRQAVEAFIGEDSQDIKKLVRL